MTERALKPAREERRQGRGRGRPPSILFRLVLGYTAATLVMLSLVAALMHEGLKRNFETEDAELLSDSVTTVRHLVGEQPENLHEVKEMILESAAGHQLEKQYGRLLDSSGKVLVETPGAGDLLPPAEHFPGPLPADNLAESLSRARSPTGIPLFLLAAKIERGNGAAPYVFQVALDIHHLDHWMDGYRNTLILMCAVATGLAALMAWAITRRGLRPLVNITAAAQKVTEPGLTAFAGIGSQPWPRELSALAREFDQMLERLRKSFERLSSFTADAAHEFRTPLSNLLGSTSLILSRPRPAEEYRALLESNAEEYQRLARMTQSLLFLARADGSALELKPEGVNALQAIHEVLDFFAALAEEKGIILDGSGGGTVRADAGLLRMALSNLVSNAVHHTPAGGKVSVAFVAGRTGAGVFTVKDEGTGIPEADQSQIFERFYQVDKSRTTSGGAGSGLGLAIVKTIMELHRGTVLLERGPPAGAQFQLRFP